MTRTHICIYALLLTILTPLLAGAAGMDPTKAPGERMRLLVLPCESSTLAVGDLAQVADDLLMKALLEQKRFRVVEKEKMQQVMREQQLSREKLTAGANSIRLGRLAAAEALVATGLQDEGKLLRLTARIILTETGVTLELAPLQAEPGLAGVRQLADKMVTAIMHALPLMAGEVVRKDGAKLFVRLTGADTVPKGMKFMLYRSGKEIKHPITGRSLGVETLLLGEAVVGEIVQGTVSIQLADRARTKEIRVGDRAVTK